MEAEDPKAGAGAAAASEDTKMEDAEDTAAVKAEVVEAAAEAEGEEMATADPSTVVEAALQAAQLETEVLAATAASISKASAIPALDPSLPTHRDVKLGDESHPATMLLLDLMTLHKVLLFPPKTTTKESGDDNNMIQASDPKVQELATKLTTLFLEGKQYQLSGLKDVPRAFLVGKGRFFDKKNKKDDSDYVELAQDAVRERVVETIVSHFQTMDKLGNEPVDKETLESFEQQFRNKNNNKKETTAAASAATADKNKDEAAAEGEGDTKEDDNNKEATTASSTEATTTATTTTTNGGTAPPPAAAPSHAAPRPCDVLFLPTSLSSEDSAPYDHQTGNKHLLYLASQNVVVDTKEAAMRVQIALKLLTSKIDVSNGSGETLSKQPRYILQQIVDNQSSWKELEAVELAEFATIFVFEVYLEKQIHGTAALISSNANGAPDTLKASTVPLEQPTVHDVLFGRGGMTNGHPGNRRFRDIIALHRPDYIRATKMDKPKVARRIVKAIRHGNPPGRFLKKADDGKWYDVGDRCAAEKTSQGLRERSNAEKRQRSAMREALRIRKEDLNDDDDDDGEGQPSSSKKQKTGDDGMPLSLSMKEKKAKAAAAAKKPAEGETSTEDLPPNAVDKDGNILVTDHDILCGRGGLTNHHKGNKRFRDIVALHRPDYVRAPKIQKPSVARVIVRAIRNGDPPGRFLRKDKKTGMWYDIGDKRAAEKTSQALREKTKDEQGKPIGLSGFEGSSEADGGPAPVLPLPSAEGGGEKTEAAEEPAAAVAVAAAEEPKAAAEEEKEEEKTKTQEEAPSGGKGQAAESVPVVEI